MTKVTQGQSSRNWVYGPNINFQFCCVTNIPTISTSHNNKHICSSNSVSWLGVGQGLAGVALFCSMCLSSGGLSQACSPGMAEKQESKGKHARPQKVQSQNWHNVNSASFSWLKKVTWLYLNQKSGKLFSTLLVEENKSHKAKGMARERSEELKSTIQSTT